MSCPKKRNVSKEEKNQIMGGTLYLVATPIGNLADISERALKVLSEVDFVAAEDTRNTGLLLSRYGISKPMISYFEHNKRERGEIIAEKLSAGESGALVTDAGTPAISDPGEDIVRLCAEKNIPTISIPGACAAIVALTLSGLPTGRFAFEGFLSTAKNERRKRFASLELEERTMIFYEAPHRLKETLSDMISCFGGERRVALCRELTKLNEEVLRTSLAEAASYYEDRNPRGEYVLIVEGRSEKQTVGSDDPEDIATRVATLTAGGLSKMEAIKACAKEMGVPKSVVYDAVNNL